MRTRVITAAAVLFAAPLAAQEDVALHADIGFIGSGRLSLGVQAGPWFAIKVACDRWVWC